jgi:hypothetical protein
MPVFGGSVDQTLPSFFFRNEDRSKAEFQFILNSIRLHAGFGRESVVFWNEKGKAAIRFVHASPDAVLESASAAGGVANFLIGRDAKHWRTGVEMYSKIRYRELYPGIDAEYLAAGGRMKSQFVVSAGGDPGRIRIAYPSSGVLAIEKGGSLVYRQSGLELREEAPEVLQGGRRIAGRYRLVDDHTVGFEIGGYDPGQTLVIDPVVSYCTYLGGSGLGAVTAVATDSSGNEYVAGYTEASNFPVSGGIQLSNRGGVDAVIAKLNPTGTAVVYATYIGGYGDDRAAAIAVDAAGEAIVVGSTASANFPLASAIRATLGGGRDGFVLKLNAAGNGLVYSTYLGGSGWDQATAAAVDSAGNAYIAGDTQSSDFPVLSAPQPALGGATDAFVAELNPTGAVLFSTYLGGISAEHAAGIAVDLSGNIYVAGGTYSSNFPATGAVQASNGGGEDAFVTKLTASAFLYSTYLGGSGTDQANAIAVDGSGDVYIAGTTTSPNFPVTAGALRTAFNNISDAFVAKLNAGGSSLGYASYLGGSASNGVYGIAVDSHGNVYAAGATTSWDFPVVNAIQSTLNGLQNAFISELNPSGSMLLFSTYYGGSGADIAYSIALDASNIYAGGQTSSSNFPLVSAQEPVWGGTATGWAMKLAKPALRQEAPRDFLGNQRSDVLIYDPVSGTAYTGLSNGDGTFNYVYNLFTPAFDILLSGDWTGSGRAGMVVYSSSTGLAYIGTSNGNGTFQFSSIFWSPGYSMVVAGDWNGDGKSDIILYNPATGTMYTLLSQSASGANFIYQYSLISANFTNIAVGDFNGDGNSDILLYRASDGLCFLGLSNGNGVFQYSAVFASPGFDVEVADFNADGKADVILYNAKNGSAAVGLSTGAGFTFTPQSFAPGLVVRTGDFNGDGIGDIVLYNPSTGGVELGLGMGNGSFTTSMFSSSGGATSVVAQDLNADGKTDLLLYNRASGAEFSGISSGSGFTFSSSFWGSGRTLAQ